MPSYYRRKNSVISSHILRLEMPGILYFAQGKHFSDKIFSSNFKSDFLR